MWIDHHLGTSFEIWNGRHTWFWFVADSDCKGAAIGAGAGAGAGAGGSAFTGNKEIVLPAESDVTFELTQEIKLERM